MADIQKEEVYLPQETIHHIQSFLNTKESAQTSLLSKSWLAAWSTRPVLIFDEDDFPKTDPHPLPILCMETLNRYKTLNLKADKFVLRITGRRFPQPQVIRRFIISALTLGINEIVLRLDEVHGFFLPPNKFDLPAQLFAFTTLTRLSVDCGHMHMLDVVVTVNRVLCSRLTSLILSQVHATDDVMREILLGCPLTENLALYCKGLENINVSKLLNLVEFRAGWGVGVEFMDGRKETKFHYLRKLDFNSVKLSDDFFTKFPFMFPCIEDFTLANCLGCQVINISSHSLRHLTLSSANSCLNKVQLNVPNITKFKFEADGQRRWENDHFKYLPSLSFDNVSRDCESEVQLVFRMYEVIDARSLRDLKKFLIQLTHSRISLFVSFNRPNIMLCGATPCCRSLPEVENLTICGRGSKMSENVLHGLARTCSPKVITKCMSDCCFRRI